MNIYIILVNFNGYKLTEECIQSIYKSNYSCNYNIHIIVVDNGSKINEAEKIKIKYPDLIFIRSEINLGFAGGNNLGIKYALSKDCDYVLLINNDTVIDENMIENLLSNANPNFVESCKMLYFKNPNVIWCEGGYIDWNKGNAYNGKMGEENIHDTKKFCCDFTSGCCMLISKKIIKTVGLLKENFFMYCEDTEYCLRLKKAGVKIIIVPQAILYHKVSASSGGENTPFSVYYLTRNRLLLLKEYPNFFGYRAFLFSIISRYIRMLQFYLHGNKNSLAIKYAIYDFKHNKSGKVNYSNLRI